MSGVHFIDGRYYVAVNREAKIGDYVTKDGILRIVSQLNEEWDSVEFDYYVDGDGEHVIGWGHGTYKTLEPLQTEASPDVLDLLASLSRKIVSLESQLRDTQRNVEKLSHELAEVNHLAVRNENDIADLDERVIEFGDTSKSGAKLLAEAFAALARYEEARR